ncbi:MAG TPA: hypothetical protein VGR71_11155, partial [Nitrospira sp.]|nr:hypothetical protein [Nitrospira sp.]
LDCYRFTQLTSFDLHLLIDGRFWPSPRGDTASSAANTGIALKSHDKLDSAGLEEERPRMYSSSGARP